MILYNSKKIITCYFSLGTNFEMSSFFPFNLYSQLHLKTPRSQYLMVRFLDKEKGIGKLLMEAKNKMMDVHSIQESAAIRLNQYVKALEHK